MSDAECGHDKRFGGVFFLPKEDRGCLACACERLAAECARLAKEIALLAGDRHPGYIIGQHWMTSAYQRVCGGEDEAEVMRDYGYQRAPDNETDGH